jgi:hypothetical protein
MKKLNYEKGLARIAKTLGILGASGLILYLLFYFPSMASLIVLSQLFMIAIPLSLAASHPVGKIIFILLGITIIIFLIRFFIKGFRYQELDKQQNMGTMKINRRIVISALIIVLVGFGGGGFLIYSWYWQTHTGSRSGQVFDANTGKPIERAVVNYTWHVAGFLENAIGGGGPTVSYETLTDKEGKYYIPNLRVKRKSIAELDLEPEEILVYKDKYVAYKLLRQYKKPPVGWSFGYLDIKQPYREKNNIIKLYPFKEGDSHDRHISWIGMHSPEINKLLLKELKPEEERAHEENLKKHGGKK